MLCHDRTPRSACSETAMLSDASSRGSVVGEMSIDGSHEDADRRSKHDSRTDSWLNAAELTAKRRQPCDSRRPMLADRDAVDSRCPDEAERTRRNLKTGAGHGNERLITTDWQGIVAAE